MKKTINTPFIKTLLCLVLCLFITQSMEAQKKRRPAKKDAAEETAQRAAADNEDSVPFGVRLNTEIKLGNLSFNQGFGISMKANTGYKITNALSAGIGGRFAYNTYSQFGPDLSAFDYGALAYGKMKLGESFYIQGEFNLYSFQDFGGNRQALNFPTIGIGYMQSDGGDWAYGAELLYITNDAARDNLGQVVEYWINFSHRF